MKINWYPGHMNKAKKKILESLKLIDLAIELRDARIPESSRNPDFDDLLKEKERLIFFTKKDYADPNKTKIWIKHMAKSGIIAQDLNCTEYSDITKAKTLVQNLCRKKRDEVRAKKGIEKTMRLIVLGIPNVGKSTFINKLAGSKKTKTEDRPGVTRGNQWIKIDNYTEILDTPGILWPNLGDEKTSLNLAYTGSIKHDVLNTDFVAKRFVKDILKIYPEKLFSRYDIDEAILDEEEILDQICRRLGLLKQHGELDKETAYIRILRDFQTGRLGKITLETPVDIIK